MSEERNAPECSGANPAERAEQQAPAEPTASNSAASTPSTSSGSSSSRESVYSHIPGVDDIQHLRSFRPGRRRSIYRLIGKAKLSRQYEHAIKILGPIFAEETRRQEEAATLVAAAIEHFSITVTGIADQLEGKALVNEYAEKIEKLKRRQQAELAKIRLENPEEFEQFILQGPADDADEEEEARRLQEEIEAAINAISTGDRAGERLPNLFTVELAKTLRDQTSPTEDQASTSKVQDTPNTKHNHSAKET